MTVTRSGSSAEFPDVLLYPPQSLQLVEKAVVS